MDKRWVLLFVITAVAVAVAGAAVAARTWIFAVVVGVAALLVLLAKTDWWQRLYAVTLILMMGATSTLAPLLAISNYGRYAAAALLLAVTWVTTRNTPPVTTGILHKRALFALWLTVVLAAASLLWSASREDSLPQVVALTILVALVQLLSTRRWTDRALMVSDLRVGFYVVSGAFAASIAAPFVGIPGTIAYGGTEDTVGRFQGLFDNPNMLGLLSAITIPLGWGLFHERPGIVRLVALAPAVVTLFLAESRTAIIAAGVAMLWTILRSGAKALLKTCLLTFLIGVLVLVTGINPLGSSLSRFGKLEGGDVLNARGDIWEAASRHILQQPIGYGWKASSTFFESMQDLADVGLKTVHNSYLQFILELGVIGLIPLAYLVWSLLALAWRGNAHGIGAGLVGVVTAGIIVQLTESAMFGTGQGYPYIVWFAVAGALATYVPKPKHEHQMDLRSQSGEAVRRLGLTSLTRPRAGLKSRTTPVGG